MKKIVTALLAATTIGLATMATSGTAEARWWGPGPIVGGVVAGAIVGSALAAPYYYPYGYYGYGPNPYGPCVWRTYWNGYRWVCACY
jgi:hypothetical protein